MISQHPDAPADRGPGADSRAVLLKKRVRHTWMAAGPLLAAIVLTLPAWEPETPVHELLDWAGYGLLIVCVLGRSWCSTYIGGRKREELITVGPFSVVRNPLYAFSFVGTVGIGLTSASVTLTVLLAALFGLYYRAVVCREEAYLTARYAEPFRRYRLRVPRWIPDFSLWDDRDEMVVRPHFYFHTIRDAAVFFAAPPLLELVEYLHTAGYLPWILRLP